MQDQVQIRSTKSVKGKFAITKAKGSPAPRGKVVKEIEDNNTQTAADKVNSIVKNINQKQTQNFRGAISKENIRSTPTKRKGGGGGAV